ncbi:hypothetical protein GOP47_0027537 [Adiantum capillus-veneris]|nr:hypothetical protein GOP47_0027537 [Adiantum capillus-veneris]
MSFPRSRIATRVLRALLSDKDSACYQIIRASCAESPARKRLFSYWRLLPSAQCLLQKTWESLRMSLTAHQSSRHGATQIEERSKESCHNAIKAARVIFVLGGPGSGKGTQCALIVEHFGFTHLSAGDLLRAEIAMGSENGIMIQSMIKEGKIVPSEVTVKLLQKAMLNSGNDKFLIDGFPRNDENRSTFELVTGIRPEFILFFDCTEKVMEKRLLGRNQGRVDDNIETIRKRFKVFVESSLPVVRHYESFDKVQKIDADRTKEEVFESVRPLFVSFAKKPMNRS